MAENAKNQDASLARRTKGCCHSFVDVRWVSSEGDYWTKECEKCGYERRVSAPVLKPGEELCYWSSEACRKHGQPNRSYLHYCENACYDRPCGRNASTIHYYVCPLHSRKETIEERNEMRKKVVALRARRRGYLKGIIKTLRRRGYVVKKNSRVHRKMHNLRHILDSMKP